MTASGLVVNEVATGKRRTFAADRWRVMIPDWDNDQAICDGRTAVVGITVAIASQRQNRSRRGRSSQAAVRSWLLNSYAPRCGTAAPDRDEAYIEAQRAFPGFTGRIGFASCSLSAGRVRLGAHRLEKLAN